MKRAFARSSSNSLIPSILAVARAGARARRAAAQLRLERRGDRHRRRTGEARDKALSDRVGHGGHDLHGPPPGYGAGAVLGRRGRGDGCAEPLEQVVADAQGVRHRGERRVHRARRGEEARVDDVEVVEVVRLAVGVERRARRVVAEADRAALVGYAGQRDALVEHRAARDQPLRGSRCGRAAP